MRATVDGRRCGRRQTTGGRAIEATLTRWTISALGALTIATALLQPWYTALAVDGSADMAGWGSWTVTGAVDASLRPMPLGVPVCLAAGVMTFSAVRGAFGAAVVGAMATLAATLLPFMLTPAVDRHVPGRESVAVEVATAPLVILAIAVIATIVSWVGYARCVLRPAPRAEVGGT